MKQRRKAAIVGVGYSDVYRKQSPLTEELSFDACRKALDDAGVAAAEVDGIFEYQYAGDSPTSLYMQRILRTGDLAAYGDIMGTGPSGAAAALAAFAAVESGACETALAFRAIQQYGGKTGGALGDPVPVAGSSLFHDDFTMPYGSFSIIPNIALKMARRNHEFGCREEDYGYVAVAARKWAALNERAVQRGALTIDDYLASPRIVDPIRLLDCDYPVSGCCAIVVTTLERARDLRKRPVLVDAYAHATGAGDMFFDENFLYGGMQECSRRLWAKSSVAIEDVDLLQAYDGFTYIALSWIEAFGFCPPGEAGAWMEQGKTTAPGGRLPMNTSGGQLAEGRLHGMSFIAEAVVQMRGEAGLRQAGAPKVSAVGVSAGSQCGGLILTLD